MHVRSSGRIVFLAACATLALLPGALAHAEDAPRWVVVHAPAFADAVEPLCELRRSQGYDVVKLDAHEVLGAKSLEKGSGLPLRLKLSQICRERPDDCAVLLFGALQGEDTSTVIPPLQGTIGRMQGKPSDNAYGCLDEGLMPDVAVGRLPARTVDEARVLIAKTIAFDQIEPPQSWSDRISLIVGHPGGASPFARKFAEGLVKREIEAAFKTLHARWTVTALLHMESSLYCVPDADLAPVARGMLEAGQLFTIYLGHSGPTGLSSGGWFLSRDDFGTIDMTSGAGVLLSCGCHACEIRGWQGQGYAFAAVRNPNGVVAAIGAHGESYGAFGKLAFEGLLPYLERADPPRRLGAWWLAMKRGVAEGKIGKLQFQLYDRADGSNGKVPLEVQREEHLEMWMLLGDPALRLPVGPPGITLSVQGKVTPGGSLLIRGRLPAGLAGTSPRIRLTVERPFGSGVPGIATLPQTPGPERDAVMRKRRTQIHDLGIAATDLVVHGSDFEAPLELPEALTWDRLILRATIDGHETRGALALTVER